MNPYDRIDDTFIAEPAKALVLDEGFTFRSGAMIKPFTIVYETFGALNEDRSNAILVCHALSPSAHAAGKNDPEERKAGWWDGMIGFNKAFDIERYFVICVNFPGSCWGTTAPSSINPDTEKSYGSTYPWVTIEDMVEAEKIVLDHLRIDRVLSVVGGSLGGMQVLMWVSLYPERIHSIISMAAAAAVPVEGVGWHIIGRKIIEADARFQGGDYYGEDGPLRGLQVARMVGHTTYLSLESLEKKFGRRRRHGTRQFEIDSYYEYQGEKFARTFDANSYIRIQAAMDEMDFDDEYGSLEEAFRGFQSPALLIAFDTDWLFPPREVAKVHEALTVVGANSEFLVIDTINGHDAFLIDFHLITPPVTEFLDRIDEETKS